LPPETGLKIFPKCVCGRGSSRTPLEELTALPRPVARLGEGRGKERGEEKGGKGEEGEEEKGGKERMNPQTKSLAMSLVT